MSNSILEQTPSEIRSTVKRGFDVTARLKNRGLRKASITLYLDELLGLEIGTAEDVYDQFGNVTERRRAGIAGDIDALQFSIKNTQEANTAAADSAEVLGQEAPVPADTSDDIERLEVLEKKYDELVAELNKTALVIQMRAVPPVIEKDCRRRARDTVGITAKGVPEDVREEYNLAQVMHLMTVMFQKITDNESGESNDEFTYQDAVDLSDYLPPSQWIRLENKMAEVQYTDAISRNIEQQEDFS